MNNTSVRPAALLVALMLGLATLAGCSKDPQEKYDDAVAQLKEARESRNDAQEKVQSKKDELKELQADLNEAEANLQSARDEVDAAAQAINKTVNDQVLFRTIQRDVLNEDDFDEAAISVGVKNRVVTLTGSVPDEQTRKLALKQAREQAGVENVIDELEIDNGESKPERQQSDQKANDKPAQKPAPAPQNNDRAKPQQQPKPAEPNEPAGDQAQPKPDNAGSDKPADDSQPKPAQHGSNADEDEQLPVPPAKPQDKPQNGES